jgi:tetratricopeptide (TPR) repeat protein
VHFAASAVAVRRQQPLAERALETSLQRTERTYLKLVLGSFGALVVLVLVCGSGFRFYRNWEEGHLVRRASTVLSGGDFKTASLNARRVLQLDPENTDAMRIMAEIAEKTGERNAVDWRRKVLQLRPHSVDDALAVARCALRVKDFATATKTIEAVKDPARVNPEFHAISAQLAEAKKDFSAAETHWAEATEMAPDESRYRLQLAIVRLGFADAAKRQDALKVLEQLRADPAQRAIATRALVLNGVARNGEAQGVLALARELQAHPDALFSDRILYLELLRQLRDPSCDDYLARLKTQLGSKPAELATLLSWMIRNRMGEDALEFTKTLPPEIVSQWPVPLAVAEACAQARDWSELEKMTRNGNWATHEFLRRAYLARALRNQELSSAAEQEFKAAQKEAINPRMLSLLTKMVADWGWQREAVELLWLLARNPETKATALQTLYQHYVKVADTSGIYRALAKLAEVNPGDPRIQNNLAQVSLLLGVDTDHASKAAEDLTNKDPSNPAFASTHAFSLLSKGDVKGALLVMGRLTQDQLVDPSVAIYYGLVLAAAGEKERARDFLMRSSEATLLPEEQALVAKAERGLN